MSGFTYVVQSISVEFASATSSFARGVGTVEIDILVKTANEQRTEYEVTVDVADLLTGTADSDDYSFIPNPKILTIAKSVKSGSVHTITIDIPAGSDDGDETVDLALQNPTLSTLDAQNTHEVTIQGAVP